MTLLLRLLITTGLFCFLFLLQSCHDDRDEYLAKIYGPGGQILAESFDTLNSAYDRGWRFLNRSVDVGPSEWENPSSPPFGPYFSAATDNGYLWVDYNSTSSPSGIISNWAVSPPLTFRNNDSIVFYTRMQLYFYNDDSTDFANRLQVRLNIKNEGLEVGTGSDEGDFDILLLDINPDYREFSYNAFLAGDPDTRFAYPHQWTKFVVQITGLDQPARGRFAFRYFVEGGGANGRGTSVGIDEVKYTGSR